VGAFFFLKAYIPLLQSTRNHHPDRQKTVSGVQIQQSAGLFYKPPVVFHVPARKFSEVFCLFPNKIKNLFSENKRLSISR